MILIFPAPPGYMRGKIFLAKSGDLSSNRPEEPLIETPSVDLRVAIERLEIHQAEGRKVQLLESLDRTDATFRFSQIEKACQSTYDWIWNMSDLGFDSWLRTGNGAYMICGKPGSGKSTLLKHIFLGKQTTEALEWRKHNYRRKQIVAEHFFSNRGSFSLRSMDGLLRSLLHQIVEDCDELGRAILPIYERRDSNQGAQWTRTDLEDAFKTVRTQQIIDVDILLILDALDEYEGDAAEMAKFLKESSSCDFQGHTQIRICFSSRPHSQFDSFLEESGFALDKITTNDFCSYITTQLEQTKSTRILSNEDPQGIERWKSMVSRISERMFLYLKLIMVNVLKDFDSWLNKQSPVPGRATKLRNLQELVERFSSPADMYEMYDQMISKISKVDRPETYVMLELVVRHEGPIDLLQYHTMVQCALAKSINESVVALSSPPMNEDGVRAWLRNTGGGLLEPHSQNGQSPQFIHKSVGDFIGQIGFRWRILRTSYAFNGQNGFSFLSRYGLALLVRCFQRQGSLINQPHWVTYLNYAHIAETTTKTSQKALFDEVEDNVWIWAGGRQNLRYYDSMLSHAVTADLRLLVKDCAGESGRFGPISAQHLLHCCIEAMIESTKHSPITKASSKAAFDLQTMFQDLITYGCEPSTIFQGMTPFQVLFSACFEGFGNGAESQGGSGSKFSPDMMFAASELLSRGQDANHPIRVAIKWWQNRYQNGTQQFIQCTPLHVASSVELIQLLLTHHANINALDDNFNTPLDICLGAEDSLADTGGRTPPTNAYDAAAFLVSRGGRINQCSKDTLATFYRIFATELANSKPDKSVVRLLRNPPRLYSRFWKTLKGGQGRA